ncbi:MAG TPA: GNAT family N-acetyltransferase [Holophagaceae bacterium]
MPDPTPLLPTVRLRASGDIPAIRALMRRVYPPPHGPEAVWGEENLRRHLERFPEGQVVAEAGLDLIGTSTTMRVPMAMALAPHTWSGITGGGSLSTHDPAGDVLYGVNIAVDPAWQGRGVGRLLYEARLALGRRLGCRVFAAGARIPGYHLHSGALSPGAYLEAVTAGRIFDPTLSKQMRVGFRVIGLLPDYAPDPETLGHAALIMMEL